MDRYVIAESERKIPCQYLFGGNIKICNISKQNALLNLLNFFQRRKA